MKKNRMMRAASALLVAVLLTTCTISGTFAKYISTNEAQDSARVAKWGFNDATFEIDLFDATYGTTVNGNVTNLIAPGTTKTATIWFVPDTMVAPEVAYKIDVSTDNSSINANIESNPNIVWQLDSNGWKSWDEMLAEVEALSVDNIAPNTIPAAFDTTHTISWLWVFDETVDANGDVDNTNVYANNDINDTNMGNIAADGTDQWANLVITITATQVD